MSDCLFCSIAMGEIPADVVASTDDVVVFRDLHPRAPVHLLSIPRAHHDDVGALAVADPALAGAVLATLTRAAADLGVEAGYRVVFNTGREGGQTVGHVHAHLLSGRQLKWPPG